MTLHQFFRILWARRWLVAFVLAACVAAAAAVSLLLPPRFTATSAIVLDFKGVDTVTGSAVPAQLMPGYMATQMDILASHNVARKVVDALKLAQSPVAQQLFREQAEGKGSIEDFLAAYLLKDLHLQPSRESNVVEVSYRSADARFAAAAANSFVQAYMATTLELKVEPARLTSAWFSEQTKGLKDNLEKAQAKVSAFQREKGIIASDERLDVENARLSELSSQLVIAQSAATDGSSRQRQVNEFLGRGGAAETAPDVLANPVVQRLKADITLVQAKVTELSGKVGKNHPQYEAAVSELQSLRKQLSQEIATVAKTIGSAAEIAQQREAALRNSLSAQKARLLELRKQRDEATLLVKEVDNAQRAYDAAMARLTQTRLESQVTQTNVAVLNPAIEPIEPSSPKLVLNVMVAAFLGTVLGIGLAFLVEALNRPVRSEEDVTAALGVPVLGVLPRGRRLRRLWRAPSPRRLGRPATA